MLRRTFLFFLTLVAMSVQASTVALDSQTTLQESEAAIGRVPKDVVFKTIDGRAVRLSDYRGKPVVLSPIYTSCYHICALTTQRLAAAVRVAHDALGPNSFIVLSVGFDAVKDTPNAMAAFARQQNVRLEGWEFLSGDVTGMKELMDDIGFRYVATPQGFDHVVQTTVLDAEGKIYRQIYGGSFETPLLVEPLKELVLGTPTTAASFLSRVSNRVKLFCTVYDPASDRYRFDYSIFLGIFIGFTSLGVLIAVVVLEWRRGSASIG